MKELIIFLLFLALIGVSMFYFVNLDMETRIFYVNKSEIFQGESYALSSQFYPNMRFSHLPITYSIEYCSELSRNNMLEAMNFLDNMTGIKFQESSNPEVFITCDKKKIREEEIDMRTYIAGEGGPTSIVNTSLYHIIQKGQIIIFSSEDCFNVELHELLHVLGFDHSSNPESVMYNISSCNQYVTHDITDEIKRLYSQESLPELAFEEVQANRTGDYLNIEVNIKNRGLDSSEDFSITLFDKKKEIDSFDFGELNYGAGKTLTVQNIRTGNIDYLKIVIDYDNNIREIDESNNKIELFL